MIILESDALLKACSISVFVHFAVLESGGGAPFSGAAVGFNLALGLTTVSPLGESNLSHAATCKPGPSPHSQHK